MNTFQKIAVAVAFSLVVTNAPRIGRCDEPTHQCARCGSTCVTCKVCRPVEETKKVSKTEYECECEDFCVPGRSDFCGYDKSCDDCGKVKCTKIWQPTCACVRSRKVLKKKTVEEEVKQTKWVVEELCDACANDCRPTEPIPQPTIGTTKSKPWSVESQEIIASDQQMSKLPYYAPSVDAAPPSNNQNETNSAPGSWANRK